MLYNELAHVFWILHNLTVVQSSNLISCLIMSGISRLPALPSIQDLIRIYKLSARKQLSQNFLLDMNLTNKIVRAAGKLDDGFVCEVGPGPGGITRSLLNSKAKTVAVIEKDRRMLPSLQVSMEFVVRCFYKQLSYFVYFNMVWCLHQ